MSDAIVKSAWLSKINWTQAIAFAAMMLTMFGIDLPTEVQVQILAAITAGQSVITWALKTFFTTSITPASAAKV